MEPSKVRVTFFIIVHISEIQFSSQRVRMLLTTVNMLEIVVKVETKDLVAMFLEFSLRYEFDRWVEET